MLKIPGKIFFNKKRLLYSTNILGNLFALFASKHLLQILTVKN